MKGFPLGSQPCVLAGRWEQGAASPGEARLQTRAGGLGLAGSGESGPCRAAQAPAEGLMEPSFSLRYPTGSWGTSVTQAGGISNAAQWLQMAL